MQTIPKQVLGIQLPTQTMEVPIVRRSSTVLTAKTIVQAPRGCTDVEKREVDEVVRSISQERDEQRTIGQIENMKVPQIQDQIVRGVKVILQELSLSASCSRLSSFTYHRCWKKLWKLSRSFTGKVHRQDRRCDRGGTTPNTNHPDSCEDSGEPTSAIP